MHQSHECNVLTDPLNLSALVLPTCMQCIPIFELYTIIKRDSLGATLHFLTERNALLVFILKKESRVQRNVCKGDKTGKVYCTDIYIIQDED